MTEEKTLEISKLIYNVALLFIMMIPGLIMKKCHMASENMGKGLSNLVLYIAQPALIVYAYINYEGEFKDIWLNALLVLIFSTLAHIVFAAAALSTFKKAPDNQRRMLRFATVFANAAFMGIPLIEAILGAEAAIYASIYNVSFNLILWTLGVELCTANRDENGDGITDGDVTEKKKHKIHLWQILTHPVNMASFIGIICLVLGLNIHTVNLGLVADALFMLKSLVAPLSMVVIGLRLADIDLRGVFKDKYLYEFLALRHFLLPLAVLLIMKLISIIGVPVGDTVTTVVMIMACAPAATSATMFAEKFNCDAVYVSRAVIISTVICIATMPLVIMVSQLVM